MARSPYDPLADILEAIEKIREYTRGGKAAFGKNAMIRDAVAARLMQIGQCVKDAQGQGARLSQLAPAVPWRDIAGMRDRLAHKYWQVDQEIVWNVIESELEKLKEAIEPLLDREQRPGKAAPRGKKRRRNSGASGGQ
jgi:uncharacterized protein with HEPN domain